MNCWHCGTELIWGGDSDLDGFSEEYDVVTNLSCPNCGAAVEVYRPNYNHEDMKEYKETLENDGVVVDVPSKITNLKAKGCLPLGKKKGVFHS